MWKFPSERLAEKIAEARERVSERAKQEGRQEIVKELEAKGIDVPDEVKAKTPDPPSRE